MAEPGFKIIAHRGSPLLAPENSLEGFRRAVSDGAHAVEFDIQLTADGVPVVIHDWLLDRTTNVSGYVRGMTSAEIREKARLANGEPVPTLIEVLDVLRPSGVEVYLEIVTADAGEAVASVATLSYPVSRLVFSSFHHRLLRELRTHHPEFRLMAVFECAPIDPVRLVREAGADEAGVCFRSIDTQLLGQLTAANIPVYGWTVNDPRDIAHAKAMGLAGVFTDSPEHRSI